MGQLTPFGSFSKWLLIPAALAGIGYFFVGPRLGSSTKAANAIRSLPPKVRNAIPIPGLADEETASVPDVKVSVRPVDQRAPDVAGSSRPITSDPDEPEVEPAPPKKKPKKKKKVTKPKPAVSKSDETVEDPASAPPDRVGDPAGDPASTGGGILPTLLQ